MAVLPMVLPHKLWGLDPLFHARIKLNICEIHKLERYSDYLGVYRLMDHPIANVCIMGDLRGINRRETVIIYKVDDGTGCISCCWRRGQADDTEPPVELGNLVRVWGKISEFNEIKEIQIARICKESDPNVEILHWLEIIKLKKTAYCKPFNLPPSFTSDQTKALRSVLMRRLKQCLSEERDKSVFTAKELEKMICSEVPDTSQDLADTAIKGLASLGYLVPTAINGDYQFFSDDKIIPVALSIFKRYKEFADPSLSIEQLHQQLLKSHISRAHLTLERTQQVLQQLIEDNVIYPTEENRYQLV